MKLGLNNGKAAFMREGPTATQTIPTEVQKGCTDIGLQVVDRFALTRATRPSWTEQSPITIVNTLIHLDKEQANLPTTDRGKSLDQLAALLEGHKKAGKSESEATTAALSDLIEIKTQTRDLRQAFAKSITLTPSVREAVHKIQDEQYPREHVDPSNEKTVAGVLDAGALNKKIQRNIQRVKIGGIVYSGSALAISNILAQQLQSNNQLSKQQSQQLTVRAMNNVMNSVVTAEETKRENIEHDSIEKSEDELAFEEIQAEVIAENESHQGNYEINNEEDLYKTLGIKTDAEPEGRALAADRESTRLTVERMDAIADVQGAFVQNCSEIRASGMNETEIKTAINNAQGELKGSLDTIEKGYQTGMHKLGKADSILSDFGLKSEYDKQFTEEEFAKLGDERNSALQPHVASTAAKSYKPSPPDQQ
ncbi:MAG: hypothetical protein P1U63_11305 [Coxiellaceae bacterium]|nr:hypothetical protein [Coxiellaceae bacterium]